MRWASGACLVGLLVSWHGTARAHGEHFEHSIGFDHALGVLHVAALAHADIVHGEGFELELSAHANVMAFSTLALDEDASDGGGPREPARVVDVYGNALAPSAALTIELAPWLAWTLQSGAALRASDDQALAEGEGVAFARALALETAFAARATITQRAELEASAHAFVTRIQDDVAFDAEGSIAQPITATRYGGAFAFALAAGPSHGTLSATWLEARSARRGAPWIDFARGAALPFVPAFVARFEQELHGALQFADERVELGAAVGIGVLGPRALEDGARSRAFAALDVALWARLRGWAIELSIENALDTDAGAAELYYASDLLESPDAAARARTAAGGPRALLLGLSTVLGG